MECRRGFPCLDDPPCVIERASEDELDEQRKTSTEMGTGIFEEESGRYDSASQSGTRRAKRDSALKDQQSTGRKRAAKAYPLHRDSPCEWREASVENPMGGGKVPVPFPCDGMQQARHHGPDKNTLNNEPGNVHRICHWHHNNWHQMNDADYDWANAGKVLRD